MEYSYSGNLFTAAYCIYIGYFDTFYSLGLYLVLAIQILAVFLFGIVYFQTKKNINKSLIIVAIVISAIQLAWIISELGKEESACPYRSYPCIDENKFIQLVESNTIDEKSLRKIVYLND